MALRSGEKSWKGLRTIASEVHPSPTYPASVTGGVVGGSGGRSKPGGLSAKGRSFATVLMKSAVFLCPIILLKKERLI